MTVLKTRISKKGFKVSLVKKISFGVSLFYKNGKESHFYACKTQQEAEDFYENKLVDKYK